MIELSVALVVAGLLSWASFSAYETVSQQQQIERGRAQAQQLQSILRAFALRNGRLPCPDVSAVATGYESFTAGACSSGNQLGWFPYVSLGLEIPTQELRARYAVFRASNANVLLDADLAVSKERTGDSVSEANYLDVTDLIAALVNASALPLSTARAYLTGMEGRLGPLIAFPTQSCLPPIGWLCHCKTATTMAAVWTPHTMTSLCAASPSAPLRFASDDVVVAESPAQLAGWLRASLP